MRKESMKQLPTRKAGEENRRILQNSRTHSIIAPSPALKNKPYCDLCEKRVPVVIRYRLVDIPDLCPMHHDDVMSVKEEIRE